MKVIDFLVPDLPKNRSRATKARIDTQYLLTKELRSEIEEALSYGYSWSQICKASERKLRDLGKWNEKWNCYQIEKSFKEIKKEG
ncbi:MAG: hypothetical protein RR370_00935 [Synergistaceae bacterium]